MASTHRITRAAYLESLRDFRAFIQEHCATVPGVNNEVLYDVQLAVDEACTISSRMDIRIWITARSSLTQVDPIN
jgi:hypothetical protein